MLSSELSISLGLRGISHVLSTGCTSSTDAIGYAASLLRAGDLDVVLSGGADGCVPPGMIFGFSQDARRVDALQRSRRRGVAAVRSRPRRLRARRRRVDARARARGPRARTRGARLRGGRGVCLDVRRLPPRADGSRTASEIVACIEGALRKAGRAPEEIGYINYHGTSTLLNDAIESRCVRRVFGAPGRARAGLVHQVDDRPSAGRQRCGRRRHDRAGAVARVPAADREPDDPDPACDMDFIPLTRPGGPARSGALQLPGVRVQEQRARAGARVKACVGRCAAMACVTMIADRGRRSGRLDRGAAARARRRARSPARSRHVPARQAVRRHDQSRARSTSCGGSGSATDIARAGIPIRGMVVTGSGGVRVRGEYGRRRARGVVAPPRPRCDAGQHAVQAGALVRTRVLVQEPLVTRCRRTCRA